MGSSAVSQGLESLTFTQLVGIQLYMYIRVGEFTDPYIVILLIISILGVWGEINMSYEDSDSRILKPCYPSGRRGRGPRSGRDCFRIRLSLSVRNLFADHDVKDHVVCMLHAD